MPDHYCFDRLARIEQDYKNLNSDYRRHRAEEGAFMNETQTLLREIRAEQNNQKGFYRGMVFSISAIAAGIGIAASRFFGS